MSASSVARPARCEASCMPQYKACGITTVDDLDTAAGRLAAVLTLGGATGNFGNKDSADQLFPEITARGPGVSVSVISRPTVRPAPSRPPSRPARRFRR